LFRSCLFTFLSTSGKKERSVLLSLNGGRVMIMRRADRRQQQQQRSFGRRRRAFEGLEVDDYLVVEDPWGGFAAASVGLHQPPFATIGLWQKAGWAGFSCWLAAT
jgi:hypothetical protein